jgi:FAD binding domain/Respiratory-chain NADH dehydrogenase, 30 Kd subunit
VHDSESALVGIADEADVIVVGAGPGGSAAAYHMARHGLRVLILEKTEFPREKVCGDGLTPRATRQLIRMGVDTSEKAGWLQNKGLRVIGGGVRLELDWPELASFPSYGLVRTRLDFDDMLAGRAVEAGAILRTNVTVTGPVLDDDGRAIGVTAKVGPGKEPVQSDGGVPATQPVGANIDAPAQVPPSPDKGMFGVSGSGDVSGFGGLVRKRPTTVDSPRPFGGYFDEVYDALEEAYPGFSDAIERVVVDRGELTLHIQPERIAEVCQIMRDDESLRFELCSSVDGVDYLGSDPRRLHVTYQLLVEYKGAEIRPRDQRRVYQ